MPQCDQHGKTESIRASVYSVYTCTFWHVACYCQSAVQFNRSTRVLARTRALSLLLGAGQYFSLRFVQVLRALGSCFASDTARASVSRRDA